MTFVITQHCCNDASCIAECPVDCIRPTPEERAAFAAAEMLYIDPDSCIDCGACVEACPVGAVSADFELPAHLQRYTDFNAGYFLDHPLEPVKSTGRPGKPDADRGELAVAVIGAGPSGAYVTEELLSRGNVRVSVYDSLPTPWGLLRSGVAPDHLKTKDLAKHFEKAATHKQISVFLNVHIGTDLTVPELFDSHHAVVLATGAADPQPWNVPGADLPGVHAAAEFVAWYNGHPDYADLQPDLSSDRAVIVGNGNVALDMARVLLMNEADLMRSDVADHALQALASSNIREVVVLGRRGPLQAAYTSAELHALGNLADVDVIIDADEAALDEVSAGIVGRGEAAYADKLKADLAAEYAQSSASTANKRLVLRFFAEPTSVEGTTCVERVQLARTRLNDENGQPALERTDELEELAAGLVLTSIGYRGRPVVGVPFDETRGVIPSDDGRVCSSDGGTRPGLYAAGWIRRGAQGGLGSSRVDAIDTADTIIADFNAGLLGQEAALSSPHAGTAEAVDLAGWAAIDALELAAGAQADRPRVKIVALEELVRHGLSASTRDGGG